VDKVFKQVLPYIQAYTKIECIAVQKRLEIDIKQKLFDEFRLLIRDDFMEKTFTVEFHCRFKDEVFHVANRFATPHCESIEHDVRSMLRELSNMFLKIMELD